MLRYGWEIANLPTFCPCESKFDIQHSVSSKKGGFVSIRYNDLRDLTARRSLQRYGDKDKIIIPLSGEELHGRTTNQSRVFDPNACRYLNKSQQQCHAMNEHEKKRSYNELVPQVDHRTFTSLVLFCRNL